MVFGESYTGVAYLFGDIAATIAFLSSAWIAGAAFINLGSDKSIDAPLIIYIAWICSNIFTIFGQFTSRSADIQFSSSGLLGLSPTYPITTVILAIAIFLCSRFIRKRKYAH